MTLIAWPNPTRPSRISVGKGLAQEPERSERFLAAKPYGDLVEPFPCFTLRLRQDDLATLRVLNLIVTHFVRK
mgnify:CR=1 FL=1